MLLSACQRSLRPRWSTAAGRHFRHYADDASASQAADLGGGNRKKEEPATTVDGERASAVNSPAGAGATAQGTSAGGGRLSRAKAADTEPIAAQSVIPVVASAVTGEASSVEDVEDSEQESVMMKSGSKAPPGSMQAILNGPLLRFKKVSSRGYAQYLSILKEDKKSDRRGGSQKNTSDPKHMEELTKQARRPFPNNPWFAPGPCLGYDTRQAIMKARLEPGEASRPRQVAAQFKIGINRLRAVEVLNALEEKWAQEGKVFQTIFEQNMERLLGVGVLPRAPEPLTRYDKASEEVQARDHLDREGHLRTSARALVTRESPDLEQLTAQDGPLPSVEQARIRRPTIKRFPARASPKGRAPFKERPGYFVMDVSPVRAQERPSRT